MDTYNLFHRKAGPELVCAVPEDRAVPPFINGDAWEFGGRTADLEGCSWRFNHEAAEVSVHYNGFYLFQVVQKSKNRQCRRTLQPP